MIVPPAEVRASDYVLAGALGVKRTSIGSDESGPAALIAARDSTANPKPCKKAIYAILTDSHTAVCYAGGPQETFAENAST